MTTPVRPPASAAASSRSSRAVASAQRGRVPRGRVVGEQDPGQGDVLVLAQVGQRRRSADTPRRRAQASASADVAGGGEHPGPGGGDRSHVGREVADVDPLGLLEQVDRGGRRRPRPRAAAPSRPATGRGSAAGRPPRRARRRVRRWSAAPARSPRSQATRLSADVHVGRAPRRRARPARPGRGRRSQVRSRVAEPALGELEVGERDRAAEHVGDVSRPRAGRPPRPGSARCAASRSPVGPGREPDERRGGGAGEQVVVARRGPGRSSACAHGAGRVAADQGERGAVHLDARPAGAASSSRSTTTRSSRGRGQQPLDVVAAARSTPSNSVARRQRRRRARRASTGRLPHDVVGQLVDPAADDGLAPLAPQRRDRELDQVGGPVDVAGGQRVPDGALGLARPRRTSRWRGGAAPATSSGRSSSRWARRTSAKRWW